MRYRLVRTFVAEHGVGFAGEHARRKRQVSMAESRGVDLDQHFVRLHVIELDLSQLKLAVELRHDEGSCGACHGDCQYGV